MSKKAQVEQVAAVAQYAAMQVAAQVEAQLDNEIDRMENMNENDLEAIRRRRIQEMREKVKKTAEWKEKGHGKYEEFDEEKQFFDETKMNDRVVIHFYRPSTWRCEVVDKHLSAIAPRHVEARIVKVNAEKCPFLAERLMIVVLPTIVCTKNNKVIAQLEGFTDLGNRDDFTTKELEMWLASRGAIDMPEGMDTESKAARMKMDVKPKGNIARRGVKMASDDIDDDWD